MQNTFSTTLADLLRDNIVDTIKKTSHNLPNKATVKDAVAFFIEYILNNISSFVSEAIQQTHSIVDSQDISCVVNDVMYLNPDTLDSFYSGVYTSYVRLHCAITGESIYGEIRVPKRLSDVVDTIVMNKIKMISTTANVIQQSN